MRITQKKRGKKIIVHVYNGGTLPIAGKQFPIDTSPDKINDWANKYLKPIK